MRRPALLLLPVLIAGSLVSCSGGGSSDLPEVSGKFGAKPKVAVEKGSAPSKKLDFTVLTEGDGRKVRKGDLLVADYLGKIYKSGKVFDNSYDRGAPSSFPIGVGGVISGWDEGLVGKKIGSRVMLSIPSDKGYKSTGNEQAGIKGDDTLIFVVDLVGAAANDTPLDASEVPPSTPTKITVSGPLNAEPKVTVGRPFGRVATGVFFCGTPDFGYDAMTSTTNTRESVPLMPASGLPFLP